LRLAHELREKFPPHPNAVAGISKVLRTGRPELYEDLTDALVEGCLRDAEHLHLLRELNLRSAMIVPLVARGNVLGAMTFGYSETDRRYGHDDLQFAESVAQRCAGAIDNARLYAAEMRARKSADSANEAKDKFLATV